MYQSGKQLSEFSLEGEILSLIIEDGYKLKYLRIGTDRKIEYLVKLAKELRSFLAPVLTPGLRVKVAGEKELNLKNGKIKLKARSLTLARSPEQIDSTSVPAGVLIEDSAIGKTEVTSPTAVQTVKARAKTQTKILVCQKSDCQKRGGAAVCKALEKALNARGLEEQVTVQGTGCLKQCKAGPNIVVMPDKTRYSRIKPAEVPAIVDKHFAVVKV
ncbi:MAG: (2Fe-2S) ferredoxin domain-containing protein [Microcoleus sp. PH2017_10_PVI_O_A]|nr:MULTISPECIES: (2Fe-2S) ferredoxin domain-containing protein [unclassified Microcoleus]MCC3540426.1 (2Fe-2S) ferredoxin domain-containing protein [Microcoleus sp. PH2017_22_RUC_O_B]MCC3558652.1 (2Fe-2S) ferredoxin domain-containing protein [Microcoleus sp. PH2017_27_LUM_O_A]TAE84268.1 MAG: (2Fe-2S) ferredoxin domain-containing protein [Oscillatoriales cyanobacterium]MCC3405355.1 (2Fe-2S) ferredoxin domain-containing protein [Microcoleus sp. PH2017_10_PVI_O_A]MCC3459345.1 (2Fe-2S) ferredoxin 